LAITDHDNFAGYEEARPLAATADIDLICGIEVSTKLVQPDRPRPKSVHVLGYFFKGPSDEFCQWIIGQQQARHERNVELAAKLQSLGVNITIEEVRALGRTMAGRPHFARLLVEKGYVSNLQEAFDVYLDEKGKAYVEKHDPTVAEGIRWIRDGGGIPSLAHPVRLGRFATQEEDLIRQLAKMGLQAIEAYHSEHTGRHRDRYEYLGRKYDLALTGGSDFHGENKPDVKLGSGKDNNVQVPRKLLDRLRMLARA
jgi:predicted metal-dependent phosphoesterase TrpH